MTIRERQEEQEKALLAPWAARSAETAGRDIPVVPLRHPDSADAWLLPEPGSDTLP